MRHFRTTLIATSLLAFLSLIALPAVADRRDRDNDHGARAQSHGFMNHSFKRQNRREFNRETRREHRQVRREANRHHASQHRKARRHANRHRRHVGRSHHGYRQHYRHDSHRHDSHRNDSLGPLFFGLAAGAILHSAIDNPPRRSYRYEPQCERVFKRGYDRYGYRVKIAGTRCYDRYGAAYIVPGSRRIVARY